MLTLIPSLPHCLSYSTSQGHPLSKDPYILIPKILTTTSLFRFYPELRVFPFPPVQYRVFVVDHKMDPVTRIFTLDIKVASPDGRVDPRH